MLELAYSICQELFFFLFSKWAYPKTKVEISFYFLVTVLQCQFMRITELILTVEHIKCVHDWKGYETGFVTKMA